MAVTLGIATLFGLALASQVVLATSGWERAVPWTAALASGLLDSWLWTLFVPPVFALTRRFPLQGGRWPWRVVIHFAAAVAVATAYSAVQTAAVQWLLPESLQVGRHFRGPKPGGSPGPGPGFGAPAGGPGREHGPDRGRDLGPPWEAPRRPGLEFDEAGDGPRRMGQSETNDLPAGPRELHPGGPLRERGPGGGPGAFGRGPDGGRGWRGGPPPPSFTDTFRFQLGIRWPTHLLTYAMIAGAWHWLAQQRRLRDRERQAGELSRQLAEARLQALRMQLNPHFLFNTLNAIATLVHRAPRAADEMIACLSDFLRLTLGASTAPESTVRSELEFARRYLEIEKARFGERLTVTEDFGVETLDALVPTLVLQPLLENAIRHGIERREGPGEILVSARRDLTEPMLILRVADNGPGLRPEASSPGGSGSGIGLANTRARLRELHGDRASLRLGDRPGGGSEVEIRLPWKTSAG